MGNAVTLIADATIPNAKILFNSASIPGSALANGAVTATQLADDAVTAAKLANESTVDLVTSLPASGAFTGQFALDTDDSKAYVWDGSQWVSFKAAGSVNTVVGSTAGIVNIAIATSGDQVTITTSLDDTTGAAEFLAGPTGNAGAVGYRAIVGTDLPEATAVTKGAVIVDGEGLRMDDDNIEIDNDVVASATHHVVTYDAKGLITAGRGIEAGDLPAATTGAKGGVIVGTGLSVDGTGLVNHANNVISGTAAKVTFDSEGHVTGTLSLDAADIPNLAASKITTGTIDPARIGSNSILGAQIANYAVSKFGETQPTADHIGQFFFNPLSRDLFLWDGNVFQPIGISIGEIVFAGTFDASAGSGTGLIASVTAEGTSIGLTVGQPLPAAAQNNSRYYLVVSEAGTITSGNAPNVALSPPDIVLSNGTTWTEIDVSQTVTAQVASNVSFTPAGNISATNVQTALEELDSEKVTAASPTFTGNVTISTAGTLIFEGDTANDFETTLTVTDPTADRTITFPDASGNIVLSGSIVNADINASAEIAVGKLADGAARQLLQTDAAGTGVEWTSNVDIPGTLDVTGAATFDSTITAANNVTLNAQADLRFADSDSSNWVAFQAPATVSSNVTWTLPAADGTASQVLSTDGSGTLSWASAASGDVTLTGTQTLTNKTLTDPAIIGTILEDVFTITDGAEFEVDPGNGSIQLITLGASRTPKATNFAAGEAVTLMVDDGSAYTLTWSDATWGESGVVWKTNAGAAPTLNTTGYTVITFWKVGTQVYGARVGDA